MTDKPAMKTPTIHLNGSSAQSLTDAIEAAASAVREAERALADCAPNARDYYLQDDQAHTIAAREHSHRMQRLRDVLSELGEIHMAISDQVDARDAARKGRPQ